MASHPLILILITALLLFGCATPKSADAAFEEVTYCRNGGEAQKLDIYRPLKPGPGKGTVVYIHGGGYVEGDKRGWFELRRARLLTAWGFTVVSINYRFAPAHIYPAQFEDAVCALNWLKTNASARGIDVSFVGLVGDSAGGHLASLIGTLGDTGEAPRVGAVAALYPALDLVNMEADSLLAQAIQAALPTAELRARYSPIRHISAGDPPFLLVHGKNDKMVSVAQSVRFAVGLKAVGHQPLLVAVENARHGLFPSGGTPSPDPATIDKLFVAFFLKASGSVP